MAESQRERNERRAQEAADRRRSIRERKEADMKAQLRDPSLGVNMQDQEYRAWKWDQRQAREHRARGYRDKQKFQMMEAWERHRQGDMDWESRNANNPEYAGRNLQEARGSVWDDDKVSDYKRFKEDEKYYRRNPGSFDGSPNYNEPGEGYLETGRMSEYEKKMGQYAWGNPFRENTGGRPALKDLPPSRRRTMTKEERIAERDGGARFAGDAFNETSTSNQQSSMSLPVGSGFSLGESGSAAPASPAPEDTSTTPKQRLVRNRPGRRTLNSGNTRRPWQERVRYGAQFARDRAQARQRRQQLRREGRFKPGNTTASGNPALGDEAGGWGNPNSPNRS